ncbi:hypothetical protein ACM46_01470 [Chryseobacterium angstadtii]|uniref:DUF1735 domain-containing protein n=1 Tax=Chryseobacterium angstadtii TaxID=558151 RepID=A0A0J7LBB6_9FLAO|nr:hypothetical protein [Chryseobacterium angstadtii]KMQ66250.1 hypothetical protein ACM46_01470 [Chryseobacterium angstadtii]
MKTFNYLYIALLSALVYSCTNDEIHYDGDPNLNFITASSQQLVDQGSGSKVVEVQYGTLVKVPSAEVSLVVDPTSQLKEGIDFQFMGPSNPSGNFDGKIAIKLLETGASPEGKNAVFRLSSPTIKNGVITPVHTMTVALKCPVSYFLAGNFKSTMPFFGGTYDITIAAGTDANTLLLKDYYADGYDIKITYDPSTGSVTIPTQQTGYMHSTYGMVSIRQVAATASTINFCTRKVVLSYQPFVSAGNFAAVVDNIVGS